MFQLLKKICSVGWVRVNSILNRTWLVSYCYYSVFNNILIFPSCLSKEPVDARRSCTWYISSDCSNSEREPHGSVLWPEPHSPWYLSTSAATETVAKSSVASSIKRFHWFLAQICKVRSIMWYCHFKFHLTLISYIWDV